MFEDNQIDPIIDKTIETFVLPALCVGKRAMLAVTAGIGPVVTLQILTVASQIAMGTTNQTSLEWTLIVEIINETKIILL